MINDVKSAESYFFMNQYCCKKRKLFQYSFLSKKKKETLGFYPLKFSQDLHIATRDHTDKTISTNLGHSVWRNYLFVGLKWCSFWVEYAHDFVVLAQESDKPIFLFQKALAKWPAMK